MGRPVRTRRVAAGAAALAAAGGVVALALVVGASHKGHASLPGIQASIHAATHREALIQAALRRSVHVVRPASPRSDHHRRLPPTLPPQAPSRSYQLELSGAARVPSGYPSLDRAARAGARVELRPVAGKDWGNVCWTVSGIRDVARPSRVAIHQGGIGQAGVMLIPLGDRFETRGCVRVFSTELSVIAKRPATFYVELDSAGFPSGAIRSQL
jgi:hypothetical protein